MKSQTQSPDIVRTTEMHSNATQSPTIPTRAPASHTQPTANTKLTQKTRGLVFSERSTNTARTYTHG